MALSALSQRRLETCHPDLRSLIGLASSRFPLEVIWGFRNQADQDAAVAAGRSKEPWPKSRHNKQPAEAVDIVPVPLDWKDEKRFAEMASAVKACAAELGIEIVWGGDWKTLHDADHFELARKTP